MGLCPGGDGEVVGGRGSGRARGMRDLRGLLLLSRTSGFPPLLLLIPSVLLALQLLLVASRLPGAARSWAEEEEDREVAFSVISIGPDRRSSGRPGLGGPRRPEVGEEDDGGTRYGARAYEELEETHERQVGPKAPKVQRWAANEPSFLAELDCFITYITRPQLNCSRVLPPGMAQPTQPPVASAHWLLCVEEWLLPAADTPCVAYSFSLDGGDADFLKTVLGLGCEVHGFNPSTSSASDDRIGNSLAGNRGNRGGVSQHKLWLEWRAPRRHKHKTRGNLGSVSQTLADIMAALGHHTVHFMYADLLSAEWRVFQNWIEVGTIRNIRHLVATVHLHWAGFEVGGTDEEVVRYWFSILRGIEASGLHLVHSSPGSGYGVLKQAAANARSSYTLSWVNTHTRHRHSNTHMDRAEHAAVDDVIQT